MPETAPAQPVTLSVNGAPHTLALEPRHTLLDALRLDLELTGTKKRLRHGGLRRLHRPGGRQGDVRLPPAGGRLRRARVTTIEGLAGTAAGSGGRSDESDLDPVQRAFIEADAFQCGFCTPGQIMSLRALLNERPAPADDEIRRAVSGNICRCGAYQNIVEAGRRAVGPRRRERRQGSGRGGVTSLHISKLRSGEGSEDELKVEEKTPLPRWGQEAHLDVVGRRVPRVEGEAKVTGRARYAYDVRLPGQLYAAVLRSPHPHARIRRIDTSRAERLPGVHAVVSSTNAPRDGVVRGQPAVRHHAALRRRGGGRRRGREPGRSPGTPCA